MKYCTNCGAKVEGKFCTKCGKEVAPIVQKKKKTNVILIIILAVVVLPLLVFGLSILLADIDIDTTNTEVEEKTEYSLNEAITCSNYTAVVTDFDMLTRSSCAYVPEGDEWVAVYVTITNTDTDDTSFNENRFKLVDGNGQIVKNSTLTVDVWNGDRLNNFTLVPGGSKTGYIVFNIDEGKDTNMSLRFTCNSFDTEKTIKLVK